MTQTEKIAKVRLLLPSGVDITDATITGYLEMAQAEIQACMYGSREVFSFEVPTRYEVVQCMAVVTGLGLIGGNNEASHSENGISRTFVYSDMVSYIRAKVTPVAEVR